jgi:hypothetical protein
MPVLKGLDTTMELTRHAQALKAQGYDFALRYYSHDAAKNLSLGEARALSQAACPSAPCGKRAARAPDFLRAPRAWRMARRPSRWPVT